MMNPILSLPVSSDYHLATQDSRIGNNSGQQAALGVGRTADYMRDTGHGSGNVYNYPDRYDVNSVVPHQHAAESSYHGPLLSDHNAGSLEQVHAPNSSLAALTNYGGLTSTYHTNLQTQPGLPVSYTSNPQSYAGPTGYAHPLSGAQSMRISSMTNEHGPSDAMSSSRPNLGENQLGTPAQDSIRTTYGTGLPSRNNHVASPRQRRHENAVPKTPYNALEQTPRTIYSPMSISPPASALYTNASYSPGITTPESTNIPPFEAQKDCSNLWGGMHDSKRIAVSIDCRIEKGFFKSNTDGAYTCYRRNYFSIQCSYTLSPLLTDEPLFVHRGGTTDQVQALAMTLSAAVDGANGKSIELVQYTPKRDAGDKAHVGMKKVLPTAPGNHRNPRTDSFAHGLYHGLQLGPRAPLLPFQNLDSCPEPTQLGAPNSGSLFERIQFKSATANNGKRRAQQQYYHLNVELWADVRKTNKDQPVWVKVAQRTSKPVVVRGRSPSHYRNEGTHGGADLHRGAGGAGGTAGSLGGNYTYSTGSGLASTYGMSRSSLAQGGFGGGYRLPLDPEHTTVDLSPASSSSSLLQSPADASPAAGLSMSNDHFGEQLQRSSTYEYFPAPLAANYDTTYARSDSDLTRMGRADGTGNLDNPPSILTSSCSRFAKGAWPSSKGIYSRVANGF